MESDQKKCLQYALRLLSIKGFFAQELKQKLSRKGFSDESIAAAIQECQRLGYLDDEDRKRRVIERMQQKGRGPYLIAAKLQSKGVSVEHSDFEADQVGVIIAWLENRISKIDMNEKTERDRLIRSLLRKGFSLDPIFKALQSFKKN